MTTHFHALVGDDYDCPSNLSDEALHRHTCAPTTTGPVDLHTCPSGECEHPDRIHAREHYVECERLGRLMSEPVYVPTYYTGLDSSRLGFFVSAD